MKLLVVITPNFNAAATMGFLDPFRASNYLEGRRHFRWSIASLKGGLCVASNGVTIQTRALDSVENEPWDFVIVSSSWAPETHSTIALQKALRKWARQGSTLGALDTGAFLLAEAGLLAGKRATVHYEHLQALNELYPDVVASEQLYVFDVNRITCCGGSAAIDFALHIVQGTHGLALANAAARYVFHESLRPDGTSQKFNSAVPTGSTAPTAVKQAIKIMEENLERPIAIPEICCRIGISQRQLDRLFGHHVGKTPTQYFRDIRLDRARGLVTQTDMLLSEVAVASGFSSQVHFSRAYRERFGLPPRIDRVEGRVPFEFRSWPMHYKSS